MYAGFLPTMLYLGVSSLNKVNASWDTKNAEEPADIMDEFQPQTATYTYEFDSNLNWLLFAPATIQVIRMQCIDYPFRNKLGESIKDMVSKDKYYAFFRGAPIILLG